MLRPWLTLWLLCGVLQTPLALESHLSFTTDDDAARAAAHYAQDMVRFAAVELNLKLNWSDASIAQIEEVTSELHADLRRERGAISDVDTLVQMLGSYVGEVYRRNHGGKWGFAAANGKRLMVIKAEDGNSLLWPIERIRQRLRSGGSNNVWVYYQSRIALANN